MDNKSKKCIQTSRLCEGIIIEIINESKTTKICECNQDELKNIMESSFRRSTIGQNILMTNFHVEEKVVAYSMLENSSRCLFCITYGNR